MLVRKVLEQDLRSSARMMGKTGTPLYVLHLVNALKARQQGCSRDIVQIQLGDFKKYVLGRDPVAEDADEQLIKLADTTTSLAWQGSISRRHLRLQLRPDGAWVLEDLDSTNGVLVNEQRVKTCVLQVGDVIRIGASGKIGGGGSGGGSGGGGGDSPLVYVFESMALVQQRNVSDAVNPIYLIY